MTRVGSSSWLGAGFMIGAFALGTSENVVAGVLPRIAASVGVSEATGGLLVSAYAATVVVAGPIVTLMVSRTPVRPLLLVAVLAYVLGSVAAALAPSFAVLVAARVLTGTVHTTILVAFILTAMALAPPDGQARAAARITLGLGLSTVVGVPVGAFLGDHVGWRWAFVLIAVLASVALAILAVWFPRSDGPPRGAGPSGLRVLTRPRVLAGVTMSALAAMGVLLVAVYIVPLLTTVAGVPRAAVTPLLLVYGVGCLVGNTVGGWLADRSLVGGLRLSLGATAVAAVLLSVVTGIGGGGVVIGLTLLGFTYFATFPGLNTWVAKAADGVSPDLALAVNSSAFNLGIAAGGALGGLLLTYGAPLRVLPTAALVPLAAAACLPWIVGRTSRRPLGAGAHR